MEENKFIVQPYPNEHACRLNNPDKYERFARKELEYEGKKYYAIIGFDKDNNSEVQAYRYDKDIWSETEASNHCKEHNGIIFEAATNINNILNLEIISNEYEKEIIKIEDKNYIKLPVVFLKEGILKGSQGPLFHSYEIFKNFANKFNNIPVTFLHPKDESNKFVGVNENFTDLIGFLNDVTSDDTNKELKGTVYLDETLLKEKYNHLNKLIEQQYPIEVSIGIYSEIKNVDNKDYKAIVLDYVPDHLAILGDIKGACSYEYGCGIRNQQEEIDFISEKSNNLNINEQKNVENMEEKKLTLNEALEMLEEKDKNLINQALLMLESKKKELIEVIVNADSSWNASELEKECICKLEKMANTIKKVKTENAVKEPEINANNYIGIAGNNVIAIEDNKKSTVLTI